MPCRTCMISTCGRKVPLSPLFFLLFPRTAEPEEVSRKNCPFPWACQNDWPGSFCALIESISALGGQGLAIAPSVDLILGSWLSTPSGCIAFTRLFTPPNYRFEINGRVATKAASSARKYGVWGVWGCVWGIGERKKVKKSCTEYEMGWPCFRHWLD